MWVVSGCNIAHGGSLFYLVFFLGQGIHLRRRIPGNLKNTAVMDRIHMI